MEHPARKLSAARLTLVQDRPREPSGSDHTIRFPSMTHKLMKGLRAGRSVGIYVANEVSERGQLQSLDQSASLANGARKIEGCDHWVVICHLLDHAQGIVFATIQHHHDLELASVVRLEVLGVLPQYRLNPVLLVVGRYEQQESGIQTRHMLGAWDGAGSAG